MSNQTTSLASQGLSPKALERLNENEKARVEAELKSKFFRLEPGQDTIVRILLEKSEGAFKSEGKSGDLNTKFRYTLEDERNDFQIEKTFDCWPSTSKLIDDQIRKEGPLMRIFATKNNNGSTKYTPASATNDKIA